MLPSVVLLAAVVVVPAVARLTALGDVDASPKYSVTFLPSLPVANETAERWLRDGLHGGEPEFLDKWRAPTDGGLKHIGSGDDDPSEHQSPLAVEHLRFGPANSYVCLIPPPHPVPEASAPEPPSESKSWELLQPLAGTCLYRRESWFTYSYCHNRHVRQFRELNEQNTLSFLPGRVPEEDPEWESYTLGRSPAVADDGSTSDETALANNMEVSRESDQHYLVQRWGDGTVCDKTGRKRSVEIQFHCSMTVTDTIVFVKEMRTCEYTLVIHTPRLCGEPAFRGHLERLQAQAIRCREVLPARAVDGPAASSADAAQVLPEPRMTAPLAEMPNPAQITPRPPPRIPAPVPAADDAADAQADKAGADKQEALRRALQTLLSNLHDGGADTSAAAEDTHAGTAGDAADRTLADLLGDVHVYEVHQHRTPDGDVVIEFDLDEGDMSELAGGARRNAEHDDDEEEDGDDAADSDSADNRATKKRDIKSFKGKTLADALAAAGYNVRTDGEVGKAEAKNVKSKQKKPKAAQQRDEL